MGARILVADDSVTIQKVVELTFSREDFELIAARSGEEAIRKAREYLPDLVILDTAMPDKSGYEVCRILKADLPLKDVPVIFFPNTFEVFDKEEAFRAGADDFITKPFESQVLIGKVKHLLSSRAAMRAEAAPSQVLEPLEEQELPLKEVALDEPPASSEPPLEAFATELVSQAVEPSLTLEQEMDIFSNQVEALSVQAVNSVEKEAGTATERVATDLSREVTQTTEEVARQLSREVVDVAERVTERLRQEVVEKLVERIERVVWEVVPDLAEVLIRQEIERIKAEAGGEEPR